MSLLRPLLSSNRINLTSKQANIYTWGWQKEARFRYAVCGRRFGKTFLCREEIRRAIRLAIEWDIPVENEIWYGAPTFKQAKRTFWRALKRSIPKPWIDGRPNESESYIALKSGHIIRIVGLDNYDDLRGSGLFFFIGDEWDDAKREAWTEVIRPMLSTAQGHALFIGTPKGFGHLYEGYVAGQGQFQPDVPHDHKSWLYTTLHGGNVPLAEIEAARRELDAKTFRQEYEASFETFQGRVYYAFDRKHSIKDKIYDPKQPLHIGMDFNVNPMTATVWQEANEDGQIVAYQIDEIIIPTSDTDEMADEITTRYGKSGFDPTKPKLDHITIYPDPSGAANRTSAQGQTDLSILGKRGFKVLALNKAPLIRDRVNLVNSRFETADGTRRAFVDPKCMKSIEAYEKQTYEEGTSKPDKDQGFDHICDATGYFMFGRYSSNPVFRAQTSFMGR